MRVLGVVVGCVAVLVCAATAQARPALFRAGAAARSINPPMPVYSGGFSLSPPITKVHDPLQVRAFYVSNGRRAGLPGSAQTKPFASTSTSQPDSQSVLGSAPMKRNR